MDLLHARKLSIKDACKVLSVGQTKLRAMIRHGEIPVLRIGGTYQLLESDIEDYLSRCYGRVRQVESKPQLASALPDWVDRSDVFDAKPKTRRSA